MKSFFPFIIFYFLLPFFSFPAFGQWSVYLHCGNDSASVNAFYAGCVNSGFLCRVASCPGISGFPGDTYVEVFSNAYVCPDGSLAESQSHCPSPCTAGDVRYLNTESSALTISDFDLSLAPFSICSNSGCSATATSSYRISESVWQTSYQLTGDQCDGSGSVTVVDTGSNQSTVYPSESSVSTDSSNPNQTVTTESVTDVVYNSDGSVVTTETTTTLTTLPDGTVITDVSTFTTTDNSNNNGGTSTTSMTESTTSLPDGTTTTNLLSSASSVDNLPESEDFGYGTGSASDSCSSPPACSDGDPQLCAILNQQWRNMCHGEFVTLSDFSNQLSSSGLTDPDSFTSVFNDSNTLNVDSSVQSALNDIDTTFSPGACPLTNEEVSLFGESVIIDVQVVCDYLPLIASIMRVIAGISASWILLSGVTRL
jgi:hypothetical protein